MIRSSLLFRLNHKRSITTLSPLGSLFNQKPKLTKTSYFNVNQANNVGLFGIKELTSYDGFYKLKSQVDTTVKSLLDEALTNDITSLNNRKLVQIFDDISNNLCKVADLAEFIRTSHPNALYRNAADQTFAGISDIVEKLNTNLALYKKLKAFYDVNIENPRLNVDECDLRVTKLYLADFEQSGIHLDELNRFNFVNVNNKLIDILMKFQINSQMPSEIITQNVDKRFYELMQFQNERINIDAMYSNSDNELLREFVYRSYLANNSTQSEHFDSILSNRYGIFT